MNRKEAIEYAKFRLECHTKGDGEYTDYGEFLVAAIEALYKLQHYEDLEERGRLIELPCKIGDTMYIPLRDNVQEYKVVKFNIDQNITIVLENTAFHIIFGVLDRAFGKTVFLTKEEAEAALKGENE